MSERVDELFGAAGTEARPRLALVASLASGGLVVALAGMFCSVVPGVLMVLLAWVVVQRDLDRVDSGFLPVTDRSRLSIARLAVWVALGLTSALTLAQLMGLWGGVYSPFWSGLVEAWVESHPPIEPPPVTP